MDEIMIFVGMKPQGEYFCKGCRQLRLAFLNVVKCDNCGSTELIHAKVGRLNKEALLRAYP